MQCWHHSTVYCSNSVERHPLLKFRRNARSTYNQREPIIRCSYKPETQRQPQTSAPPVKIPPPPPPPPEPDTLGRVSRWTLAAVLVGSGLFAFGVPRSIGPPIYTDDIGNNYWKTAKGNNVEVHTDSVGGVWMVDPAGNIYFDGGNPQLGIYMVSWEGEIQNFYVDTHGEHQQTLLGNIKDLQTVKVDEVGGFPIADIQQKYEEYQLKAAKKDKILTRGFPDHIMGFPDDTPVELPPNAVDVYEDGKDENGEDKYRIETPPVLDEGFVELEEKRNLWPFQQIEPGGGAFHPGVE